jgi:hypothetical protein
MAFPSYHGSGTHVHDVVMVFATPSPSVPFLIYRALNDFRKNREKNRTPNIKASSTDIANRKTYWLLKPTFNVNLPSIKCNFGTLRRF